MMSEKTTDHDFARLFGIKSFDDVSAGVQSIIFLTSLTSAGVYGKNGTTIAWVRRSDTAHDKVNIISYRLFERCNFKIE